MQLDDKDLVKLHMLSHAPASRILRFLRAASGGADVKHLELRLRRIINRCKCARVKRPHTAAKPRTSLRVVTKFNSHVQIDLLYTHKADSAGVLADNVVPTFEPTVILTVTDEATNTSTMNIVKDA